MEGLLVLLVLGIFFGPYILIGIGWTYSRQLRTCEPLEDIEESAG